MRISGRKDSKRIYPKDPVHILMPYLMSKRNDAEIYINNEIDITELLKWIEDKNKELNYKMTFFHAMIGIIGKTIYSRPLLNRFVKGKYFYERNEVSISFVAKTHLSDDAEERLIVYTIDENEFPIDLSEKILLKINEVKNDEDNVDELYDKIINMPSFILNIFAIIVKWLDKKGRLPDFMTKDDFNFSTVLLSNLGSIKSSSVYHHLNDYGTNSMVVTIGTIHKVDDRDIVDIGVIVDERIADGFYFAKSLKYMQHIALNPYLLDEEIGKKIKLDF